MSRSALKTDAQWCFQNQNPELRSAAQHLGSCIHVFLFYTMLTVFTSTLCADWPVVVQGGVVLV